MPLLCLAHLCVVFLFMLISCIKRWYLKFNQNRNTSINQNVLANQKGSFMLNTINILKLQGCAGVKLKSENDIKM